MEKLQALITNFGRLLRRCARTCWALGVPGMPLFFFLLMICAPRANADVGVVLNESLDEDMDRITSTGHSAVYFSGICPESPVKLRLCGPGEHGSVMSNYVNIGEDQPYEWNIVPLNIYLFGVEDSANRPLFASSKIKHLLEERYRQKYLSEYCSAASCIDSAKAEWREMVAATMIRGVHIFYVKTTLEQDQQIIAEWNDSANRNHFNGITRNCADFTRRIINTYFPHAAKTDYLNDFGMTSPKAVARTFTRYAVRHPESELRIMHFAQIPGTTKRSRVVRSGTEQLFHSGKLMLPEVLLAHFALPVVMTSYFATARFNADKEFAKYPASSIAPSSSDPPTPERIVGTDAQWKDFRKSLDRIVAENLTGDGRYDSKRSFKRLDEGGALSLDSDGSVWVEFSDPDRSGRLGLSANNIVAPGSTPELSYQLLLARADQMVKSPKHRRETMIEFQQDWSDLQTSAAQNVPAKPIFAALQSALKP